MTKDIVFSILTTTYNRADSGYLEYNIRSVQNQDRKTGIEYEHIIIDDGSTDETKDLVRGLSKRDPNIKYLYQNNTGPGIALQNGIKVAKGKYIIILDDDDALTPESLKIRYEAIIKNPGVGFIYGKATWIDEYGLPTSELFQSKDKGERLYEEMLISNCVNAGTTTCRTDVLSSIEWPVWLNRSQDYFIWLEMIRPDKKTKYLFIDDFIAEYRYHNNSYTSNINSEVKKLDKAQLNQKIRDLHGYTVGYLAGRANYWAKEAHETNSYRLEQIRDKELELKHIEQELHNNTNSRVIKLAIKTRNVIRGQLFDRLGRASHKSKKIFRKFYFNQKELPVSKSDNKEWLRKYPLVSVITPFFNREDTMPETIRSVLGQTFQNFEYIIVNDESTTDEANEYLKKIKHPKIQVINQKHSNVAGARNRGVKMAKGKYIICLDSDDILDTTYLEKAVITLEQNPDFSIASFDTQMFGVNDDSFIYQDNDPLYLIEDNTLITAAMFRKEVWIDNGGYKPDLGYEDWEFWINAAEHGHFAIHIPEKLFFYRTANSSRYTEDLSRHSHNAERIRSLHPDFITSVKRYITKREKINKPNNETALINIKSKSNYKEPKLDKKQVLVAIPWMTFGGAETLINNLCSGVKDKVDFTFITNIKSENEWEYKFKEISKNIYHLANLFDDDDIKFEFISNLIKTRGIEILHIIHSGYLFNRLDEIKKRHPKVRVIVTLFNDRAEYFEQSISASKSIDTFTSDNIALDSLFKVRLRDEADIRRIPNGIDSTFIFNPDKYDRELNRQELGLKPTEMAVFFIGRLSEEKNPDIFVSVANIMEKKDKSIKFFMVGDGPIRKDVEKQLSNSKVVYLGYRAKVEELLSAADVFILPSSVEGFPLSILEAMAMKVAVIASDVGAVRDVIEDGVDGYIVPPASTNDIVRVLGSLFLGDIMNKVGAKAREKVTKQYSIENLAENYTKLYRG